MLIEKNIMGMPQGFYIITIAEKAEVAATIAAVLSHPIAETPKPVFVPVSISLITHRRLFQDGYTYGFQINEPLGLRWINPKNVDLWMAFDEISFTVANRAVIEEGPPPRNFYRTVFPDPVIKCEIAIPPIPSYPENMAGWISKINNEVGVLKKKILGAFYDSS
ncbi:MAG: hypothetical protein JNM55_06355 [Anaerolineales bacterium]|nr:hypothetical protein [Anaerolineales bacterium]